MAKRKFLAATKYIVYCVEHKPFPHFQFFDNEADAQVAKEKHNNVDYPGHHATVIVASFRECTPTKKKSNKPKKTS